MSSQKTEHYELNQWLATDQVLRTDFNADNAKIDAALAEKAQAADVSALTETVDSLTTRTKALETAAVGFGNCRVYFTTYTANNQNARTFTFPGRPKFVRLMYQGYTVVACEGQNYANCYSTNGYGEQGTARWSGNSVTLAFTASYYLCNSGTTVNTLLALIAEDE